MRRPHPNTEELAEFVGSFFDRDAIDVGVKGELIARDLASGTKENAAGGHDHKRVRLAARTPTAIPTWSELMDFKMKRLHRLMHRYVSFQFSEVDPHGEHPWYKVHPFARRQIRFAVVVLS